MTTVSRRTLLAALGSTLTGALLAGGAPGAFAASAAEAGVMPDDPYAPYLGAGTVLRRRVIDMPLAGNSAQMAAYMQAMPGQFAGTWTASWGGFAQVADMREIGMPIPSTRLTRGSSAVVGMMDDLARLGISEAMNGEITHAVDFINANSSASPLFSWPATGGDGTDTSGRAPAEGQWVRLPPSLDLTTLGLKPFALLITRAVQKYGAFASDKNFWCHGFNGEHPSAYMQRTGLPDPWAAGGAVAAKYGDLSPDDFPWHLTEWAPVDWGVKKMPSGSRICEPFSAIFINGDDVRWIADSRYNDPEYTDPADPADPTNTGFVHALSPVKTGEYDGLFEVEHWHSGGNIYWRVPLPSQRAVTGGRIDFWADPANGRVCGPELTDFDFAQRLADSTGDTRVLAAFPGTVALPAAPTGITIPAGSQSRQAYLWVQELTAPFSASKVYSAKATFTGRYGTASPAGAVDVPGPGSRRVLPVRPPVQPPPLR